MSRPRRFRPLRRRPRRPRPRAAVRLVVLLGVALGATATAGPAEAHIWYCGHGSHYSLRHLHYRMEFVNAFDQGGHHYHRVLFHRQLLGLEDWVTTVQCDGSH